MIDLSKIRSLVEPAAGALGYELVDVRFVNELGRWTLRLMIDKEGGVSVGDCQKMTRDVETLLDVEEVVSGPYFLEVSSPGLERPLKKEADFVRYTGRMVSVKTREPIEGRRNYKGDLKGVEDSMIVMVIDHQEFRIPMNLIEKAHLVLN